MPKYGEKCNTDSDCPSKECIMTYKNDDKNLPDTRKCLKTDSYEDNIINTEPEPDPSDLFTNQECNENKDCSSGICETKKTFDAANKVYNVEGKFCINQKKEYGDVCVTNNDCKSGICSFSDLKEDENIPLQKRCIINNRYSEIHPNLDKNSSSLSNIDVTDENVPDFFKSEDYQAAKNEPILLSQKEKDENNKGRGVITEIIITIMEIIVKAIQGVINLLISGWKIIFKIMSLPFSALLQLNIFNFSKKNSDGKCLNSYTISSISRTKLLALLFPPYGVFVHLGAQSFHKILLTAVLTMFFYFPGVYYAFRIINKDEKPTTYMDGKTPIENNATNRMYNMFFYGQLIKDDICIPHKLINITITFLLPPLGLYLKQRENKKINIKNLIISFILTGLFYFPGLIYSLHNNYL